MLGSTGTCRDRLDGHNRARKHHVSWSSVHNDDAKSGLEAVCAAVPCLSPGRQALSLTSEKDIVYRQSCCLV